jgi:4-hydroxy-3-methylbut-2-enyl diphosphate reductase
MPTYFIQSAKHLVSRDEISHFVLRTQEVVITSHWLPKQRPLDIVLTCGASCPDAIVDTVLLRVLEFFAATRALEDVLQPYTGTQQAAG